MPGGFEARTSGGFGIRIVGGIHQNMHLKTVYAGKSDLINDYSSSTQPVHEYLADGGRHWTILDLERKRD
jgi:hypothetical protein